MTVKVSAQTAKPLPIKVMKELVDKFVMISLPTSVLI